MTYDLILKHCNGYVDYSKRIHVPCEKTQIGSEWIKFPDYSKYRVVYEPCPSCSLQELKQLGISESELEHILSVSG